MAPITTVSVPAFFEPGAPPPPMPLLVIETDIVDLCPDVVPLRHLDIDMVKPMHIVRVCPPPSSSLRHRSASAAPKPQSQDSDVANTSDDESPLSSLSDESDDDDEDMQLGGDVIEIPKPAGEVGRPNRGGYKLEGVMECSPGRMVLFKVTALTCTSYRC